ncbi:MAG: hypothetical protein BWY45_03419 [Euryarchaeota archaeon ADurb.Bin294]|nr:MAG: hypothetical protein BWY45_03419 [Euryarchaeota archaeon ADurb.Bin294]
MDPAALKMGERVCDHLVCDDATPDKSPERYRNQEFLYLSDRLWGQLLPPPDEPLPLAGLCGRVYHTGIFLQLV